MPHTATSCIASELPICIFLGSFNLFTISSVKEVITPSANTKSNLFSKIGDEVVISVLINLYPGYFLDEAKNSLELFERLETWYKNNVEGYKG